MSIIYDRYRYQSRGDNINDKQPYTKPDRALSDAQSRDVQFRSTNNSNPNFESPDIDNSPPSANSTHAVKMRYIHSEERLPIPDNGELATLFAFWSVLGLGNRTRNGGTIAPICGHGTWT